MKKKLTDIIMNPTRMRIIQYLMINESGTAAQMKSELTDVPPASLYRHISTLLNAGCIEICETTQIRGTVEKTYRLVKELKGIDTDIPSTFRNVLFTLMSTFDRYFSQPENDPVQDMLSISTSVLMMNDEEFMEFLKKLSSVLGDSIHNKPGNGRKPRRITFVSSPNLPNAEQKQKEL